MKHIQLILLFFISIALTATAQSSSGNVSLKLADGIIGRWKLSKVYNGKKEISKKSQIGIMETIEFTVENKYMFRTNESKSDSGFFRTNENDRLLYFETADKGSTSTIDEWSLRIDKNIITLSRREPAELRDFKYIYARDISLSKK